MRGNLLIGRDTEQKVALVNSLSCKPFHACILFVPRALIKPLECKWAAFSSALLRDSPLYLLLMPSQTHKATGTGALKCSWASDPLFLLSRAAPLLLAGNIQVCMQPAAVCLPSELGQLSQPASPRAPKGLHAPRLLGNVPDLPSPHPSLSIQS